MYNENKKININGYIAYYYPEHPRAYDNGCVYEHILVAEQILGRLLKPEECVHHIDYNKTNNNPDNLMIFKTNSDHMAYHNGVKAILNEDGAYMCPEKINKNICPVCGKNNKSSDAKMCTECYKKDIIKNIPSKEELLELIPIMPNTKIAQKYGVSDRAVGKWLVRYNIPPRGRSGKHAYYYRELAH